VSTEPILSPTTRVSTAAPAHCTSCGAALAGDQRYCLECGERCVPMSSVLAGAPGAAPAGPPAPSQPPASPPARSGGLEAFAGRNPALTVIAGVGVLLLAMGVGVLIGRAGVGKQSAPPAQVVTVGGGAPTSSTPTEAAFASDWPSGKKGFTVELQTLPQAGTTVAAVQAAKSSASGKGASSVGALKSEEFTSLTAGTYVIYSGVYTKRAEAAKALAGLKKKFPSAKVVAVSNGGGSSAGGAGSGGGAGSSIEHPAPASTLKGLEHVKGKSYEERSKNLPNVVETG
jgi:hypothetical protein